MHQFADLPEKVDILIARLSYSGWERIEVGNWLAQAYHELCQHPRIRTVYSKPLMGYPTDRVRNVVVKTCLDRRIHFALMIDEDMVPDVHSPGRATSYGTHTDEPTRAPMFSDPLPVMRDQQNFMPSALDFALEHPGPCVVAAPYCAGPPEERVLVSRFREKESDNPNMLVGGLQLECFTRDEAAERTGFEMVSALPTGLMLIDLRVTQVMKGPWFGYEYRDAEHTELASTEDTVFSRNACYLGVPQYVAWSSWAAHCKNKIVGRPRRLPINSTPAQVVAAVREQVVRDMEAGRPMDRPNPAALRVAARIEDLDGDDTPLVPLGEDDSGDGRAEGPPLRITVDDIKE